MVESTDGRPVARVGDADLVERRRAEIVVAATRLIARQGFAKTVIRDIAREAKMSVGLVYEYVRAKEDILFLIFEYWATIYEDAIAGISDLPADPVTRFAEIANWLILQADENHEMTLLFFREPGNLTSSGRERTMSQERRYVDRIVALLEEGIESGYFKSTLDVRLASINVLYFASGWGLKQYLYRDVIERDDYGAWVIDTLVRPHLTRKGLLALAKHLAG